MLVFSTAVFSCNAFKLPIQNMKTFSHATGNAPLSYEEKTVYTYNSSGSAMLTHYWFVGPYPGSPI